MKRLRTASKRSRKGKRKITENGERVGRINEGEGESKAKNKRKGRKNK
jgi:hypothetical protein